LARGIVIHSPQPNFEALAAQERIARYESEARAAEEDAKNPPRDVSNREAFIKQKQDEAAAARVQAEQARKLESGKRVNLVTYKKWIRDSKTDKNVLVARQFIAEIPFVPPGSRTTDIDPGMTVARYLDELGKRNEFIRYSNGWWTTGPATYAIWVIGSVVVIGCLWPIVLNAMIGVGMGRKRTDKPRESLWHYKSTATSGTPAASKPAVSADDERRLHQMTDKLENDLAAAGMSMTGTVGATLPGTAASDVRKLEGGPLETAAPMPKHEDDDEIEVKGEYYPVLIHHKKHHDEPAPDSDDKQN
jgi:hypothetical protein